MSERERPVVDIDAAVGGWPNPWPNVAELARVLTADKWTLIGGLMTQLHTVHHQMGVVRPTNDVDIALHIETARGVPRETATALESLGYRLREAIDPRQNTAHRWIRDTSAIDVLISHDGHADVVDVVTADHAAPSVRERMLGRKMLEVEGGTQALRRTMIARLEIEPGETTTISVPRPLGAVILKSAAHRADSRDRERHLFDAAALLACVDDPFAERASFAGSDRARLRHLANELPPGHGAWAHLDPDSRREAQSALHVLSR